MKFLDFLNEDKMTSISLKVREELSFEARKAINEWEHSNWIGGRLEKAYINRDEIFKEIQSKFDEKFAAVLPKKIKLYRGIPDLADYNNIKDGKHLESWTDSKKVAEYFAKQRPKINSLPFDVSAKLSKGDYKKAYERLKKNGYVIYNNRLYVVNKNDPEYYDVYGLASDHYYYHHDGTVDEFIEEIESDIEHNKDRIKEHKKNSTVLEKEFDVKDILWFTNDKKYRSREYIVKIK